MMSEKNNQNKMTLEEYQKKYSKPYNEKAAKSFLFIFAAAIGVIIAFCLFSIVMKIYEISNKNNIALYVSIAVAVLIYIALYVIPLFKIKNTKSFMTNVTSENASYAKKYNKKIREGIADKMIDLSEKADDVKWYSDEQIGKLAVARQTNNDQGLKDALTTTYKTDVKKAGYKMIREHALKVGVTTAISQNEKIDTMFVIIYNLGLIKDLIFLYGFRPNDRQLAKIYKTVIADAVIAYGLGNATSSMASGVVKKMGKGLDGIPILGSAISTVIDSLAQGFINSTLTVMIGFQTRKYLLKEYKLQDILDDVIITEEELENEAIEMSDNLKQDIKKQAKEAKDKKPEAQAA